ncbi:hypothetical protein I3F58_17800 [Streptomyces sp. MUM 203J]|uniref:hypothetical protein n=1 Tax=Streptomyces sp. MUM 203J TaxID=2791990 RepID=UPI001F0477ED|nr:hypothetical protein [Streptomyces sp. MUM 203J]MCH0541380.1 hypothetical protein [Streptomyces sp. MUM 203J]
MTTSQKPGWPTEEDEQWAAEVELRLALDHHGPGGLADTALAAAREAVAETGCGARELFGAPGEYAKAAFTEHVGEEYRARTDGNGLLPGERFTAALVAIGGTGVMVSLFQWLREGFWVEPSPAGLAALSGIALAALLGAVAVTAWSAGRIRGGWGFAAGAVAVVGAGMGIARLLPDEPLFTAPVLAVTAACTVPLGVAAAVPDAVFERWFVPAPPDGDERWLARLEGLLRGRHAMRAAEAHGHVREAREHLAASGDDAATAFGSAEVYALRLAAGPRRERRLERRKLYGTTIMAVLVVLMFAERVRDPDLTSFWFWFSAVSAVGWGLYTAGMWHEALGGDAARKENA